MKSLSTQCKSIALKAAAALILILIAIASAEAQPSKLERGWKFLADKEGAIKPTEIATARGWRDVQVGLSWNAQFDDLRDYMGVAWYRTSFEIPRLSTSRIALLKFGAVDYFSEVFVNGKLVGSHEGGYTPFTIDVTAAVKSGANELAVRVIDPPMNEQENRARFPEMLYKEVPHGKQNWYVQTGGIWQPVWLEVRPRLYIKALQVEARADGNVSVRVATSEPVDDLKVRVIDPSGKIFQLKAMRAGPDYAVFQTKIDGPKLWGIDQPNLYKVEATLFEDRFTDRFGFRSFEARDGRLYLNGEPFYMMAALDQDFYPETIYTPPSEDYVRDMMVKAKRLGLNMLRCHIKVPDPIYLKVADEVGMLVWYEVPSWNDFNHFSPKAAERGEKILAEMVARDWNHPSIVIQTIINESWGVDLKQEDQRRWLRGAFERAKKLTSPLGRLIVDNSACCENFHISSDLDDFHQYFSIPDNHEKWDRWVSDFAARPAWSYSPHGDARRTGNEPLIVSEFGNWGLPKLPRKLPWWFERDFGGREVTRPAGVYERFHRFGLDSLFRDFDALAEESQWHQYASLKHEIEEIRRHASIQGYVITEFTDINWEVNGLMDMWRNPKAYAADLAKIQQPDVILARLPKRNYTSGEQVDIEMLLSHYGHKEINQARVRWSTESGLKGSFVIDRSVERASVASLKPISFVIPDVGRARRERLMIEVRGRDDSLIAENSYELFIFPRPVPAKDNAIIFHDPANSGPKLAQALATAGYKISAGDGPEADKELLIATGLDDRVKRHLDRGGRAILLAETKEALPANAQIKIMPRDGSDRDGNWVTNFNWVRTGVAPFNEVAITRLLGFESARAVPSHVIEGVRGEDYADVLSGIFYGWVNNNAALAVQMRAGGGKVLLTTYRFVEYGADPYTTHLLDAFIRYASGPQFAPKAIWQ